MKLKKTYATALFVSAIAAAATGTAQAAPTEGDATEVRVTEVSGANAQPQFVALTAEQQAYCQNVTTSGLIGMGVGLVGGFFAGSGIGAFPAAIVGGLIGGASGSSSPMPGVPAGTSPFAACSSGGGVL